jgi:hypothetical protein
MTFQPTMGQREDLYRVKVTLVGTNNGPSGANSCAFVFDSFDGGDAAAKETKYRPGNGTEDEKALGGANSISNITVSALMTYAMYQWVPWMIAQNGKATMYVNKQPLDINGSPFGKALKYKGILQGVNPPKTNSTSDAPGMLSLVQSSVTPVTAG